jgi:hypothetical protein
MFFLTQIDPRAAIKGSRDPLGFQPIWTSFGRQIIGNLTTVTTSVKNFATLLLGLYFAEQALSASQHDEHQRADFFLKFEQMAAYSRYAYAETQSDSTEAPLGIRRVRQRFHEEHGRLRISAKREHQILSNQKTYGLWGLYSVAARQSGLVEQAENRLSQTAVDFVESEYLAQLSYSGSKDGAEIVRLLIKDSFFEPKGKDRRLGYALAHILGSKLTRTEQDCYANSLVLGAEEGHNHTAGRQQQMWETISEINEARLFGWGEDFKFEELGEAIKRAYRNGATELGASLESIRTLEPVLALSSRLFGFLLRRNGAPFGQVKDEIQSKWGRSIKHINPAGIEELHPRIERASTVSGCADRLVRLARSLRAGDYADTVRAAMEQNAEVMKARGGAPWLTLERNRLKVRLREESGFLPEADELPSLWINTYFINSLKTIGRKVIGKHA